jgi:hypothetical protein
MILNKMGQLIEKGPAVARIIPETGNGIILATVENVDYKSCRILVQVKDRPGNVVEAEVDIG